MKLGISAHLRRVINVVDNRSPRSVRRLTSSLRARPAFIIIGAQKCGTSSLFMYLVQHPDIATPGKKEMHFFDHRFSFGPECYWAQFPLTWSLRSRDVITGEGTPYYMFHPAGAERVRSLLPDVKLIALLRNPVKRAFSHYQHSVSYRLEPLSFEDAIDAEEERLRGEEDRLLLNPSYRGFNHMHYSYLARGIFVDQLVQWTRVFPREQLLVLKAEDLYSNTQATVDRVTEFLGRRRFELQRDRAFNTRSYSTIDPATEKRLYDFFRPHNRRLYDFLGEDMGWERSERLEPPNGQQRHPEAAGSRS
jgi:hypothetical protein